MSKKRLTAGLGAALLAGAYGGLGVADAWAQDPDYQPEGAVEPQVQTGQISERNEHPFEVGVMGGARFFERLHGLGRFASTPEDFSPKNAFTFGLRLTFNLTPYIGFEGEALTARTSTRGGMTDMWVHSYRAQAIVNFLPGGRIIPFAVLGFGGISSRVDDPDIVPHDTDSMFHAGLGAKFAITDTIGLRLDGRILAPPAIFRDIATIGEETEWEGPDWEVLLGFYVNLGAKPPAPPPPPPPAPPPPPPPDPDPDQDGILGDADRCPNEPEDKDGFEDDDGCPEPDNDGDGIPDAQDKCPDKAENFNGVDDEDGCPEEDTDGDGFFGSRDKCPDAPETVNNYKDDDGCPDEVPAAVKKFTGVIEGINFKTGSADILKGSYTILDRAIAVLKEYPEVRLEIGGHTDDRGKDDFNLQLSQKRADAVKAYFVAKGIPDNRLRAVGYGETRPIADNKREAGRAKNRRTEFQLIGQ
jgi:OOP family OmpA-OmpF porin